jgi:glycosyltransferase involved in cell wall biosynthesis
MANKILINASILTGKQIGVEVYANEVLKRLLPLLISKGYRIEVYSYDSPALLDIDVVFRKISIAPFIDKLLANNLSLHRIVWNLMKLPNISQSFDVVYSPSTHGGFGIRNQIVTVHDLICLKYPFNEFLQFLYFKTVVPIVLRNSKIIAISSFTKKSIVSCYDIMDSQISIIYNGANHLKANVIESGFIDDLGKIKGPFFLSVGLSLPHKNVERLLAAIQMIRNSNYSFVIVGRKTSYFKKMKRLSLEMNLDNVIFLDEVNDEYLELLYTKCLANIYLSLYEGFGFPPLEAANHGKISIVSEGTALSEIYEGYAIFVDPYNVKAIKARIEQIIIDNENGYLPDLNLKNLLLKYNWDATSKKIFTLISQ